jgi:aspartate carbamoyltransferase catalytic subunit
MNSATVPQLRPDGRLRHLLSLEGLPRQMIEQLLDSAEGMRAHSQGGSGLRERLAGRSVCTLFFESSTRTRGSFQLAANRLGADVLGFDVHTSSARKGESALDTMRTLEAMGIDCFVVRHAHNGMVASLAAGARRETAFINAGDGQNAHPTQGLLDMLTLRQRKGDDFSRLKVAIVGDVRHSRVARSDLYGLRTLGAGEIRVCAPPSLLPSQEVLQGCQVFERMDDAIAGVDAVMMLRLQRERMEEGLVPSMEDYFRDFGLDSRRLKLAAPDAVVMHPGPMNRGVEISDEVADGAQSAILEQVANGVAVRMAVLQALLG